MPPRSYHFNFGKIKHPVKFNYSFFPYNDYGDRFDGMTLQPRPSITKISMATNLSETVSNAALSNEFVQPTEVLQQTSSKASMVAVLVIMAVFLTITISTTSLLLAFCRKKNTVFALQKCEEQDSEYELDDIEQTDIEMLKEENGRQQQSMKSRSHTCPSFTHVVRESSASPTNQPLMCDDSPQLKIKKLVYRMPRSKTFACSVYYNARSDHRLPAYSNILQLDSCDDSSLENIYHDELVESSIPKNTSCTNTTIFFPKVTTPNTQDFLENSTFTNGKSKSRNGQKNIISQDSLPAQNSSNFNENRTCELNAISNSYKQDCVLDSSNLSRTSCCNNTAESLPRGTTLCDTRCMTTNTDDVTVSDNKVSHFENSVLVDVCSGKCTRNYDSPVKSDMFVKERVDNSHGDVLKSKEARADKSSNIRSAGNADMFVNQRVDNSAGKINSNTFVNPREDNSFGNSCATNLNPECNTNMFSNPRVHNSNTGTYSTMIHNSNADTSITRAHNSDSNQCDIRKNSDKSVGNTENVQW